MKRFIAIAMSPAAPFFICTKKTLHFFVLICLLRAHGASLSCSLLHVFICVHDDHMPEANWKNHKNFIFQIIKVLIKFSNGNGNAI